MKTTQKPLLLLSALACSLIAIQPAAVLANRAIPSASQGGVSWQVTAPNDGVSLRVSMPDGTVFERNFARGQTPAFTSQRGVLPDGAYTYELVMSPVVSPEARAKAVSARESGQPAVLPSGRIESGTFRVAGGVVRLPDASGVEPGASRKSAASPDDFVIADDLIVQGSGCIGDDCVDGEPFGFDMMRLKQNNTRLQFNDTSVGTFPANNWQIRANSQDDGGPNFLGFVDQGADGVSETGTIVLQIDAGARANSLHVASTGRVGLGTATPTEDLQITIGNTPTVRLEQNGTGGFAPQTWDMAGNEANFFIRDATAGTLPFRIRPGAPLSSIDINASGNVGLGTASPAGKFHVSGTGTQLSIFQSTNNGAVQFRLKSNSTNRRFVALNTADQVQSQFIFNDNGAFEFTGPTVADQRLSILSSGRVGIGTNAPDQLLSVNGNASKPGGGAWLAFSDERLKNIKGAFSSGLQAVLQLEPVRYEYKEDNALGLKSEGEHIGFGAEALQKVIPEAVTRNSDGYLMVNNDPILWTMLNAIKEQNKEIAELKGQLKRLQAAVVLQAEARKSTRKKALARTTR